MVNRKETLIIPGVPLAKLKNNLLVEMTLLSFEIAFYGDVIFENCTVYTVIACININGD